MPVEIRELIYDLLFDPSATVEIRAAPQRAYEYGLVAEADSTTWSADFEDWAISAHRSKMDTHGFDMTETLQLSAQVLRVCSQIYTEAMPFLYSLRKFDLTYRESMKLFIHNIGPSQCSHVRHILMTWDALEDYSRALNKDEYQVGTAGLRCIEMAQWRIKHLHGTGVRWRSVRGQEKMVCQAAYDITQKHPRLKVIAEQSYHRKPSLVTAVLDATDASFKPKTSKVKWRFVVSETDLRTDEVLINVKQELDQLGATQNEVHDGGLIVPMIDSY